MHRATVGLHVAWGRLSHVRSGLSPLTFLTHQEARHLPAEAACLPGQLLCPFRKWPRKGGETSSLPPSAEMPSPHHP